MIQVNTIQKAGTTIFENYVFVPVTSYVNWDTDSIYLMVVVRSEYKNYSIENVWYSAHS